MTERFILQSDGFNALYEDGKLKDQAKPCYLDAETLLRLYPEAGYRFVPQEILEEFDGYPQNLEDFPLDKCI